MNGNRTSVFPWTGGKGRLAEWLTGLFPDHRTYVEPFGGSGSIIWNKEPSTVEVYNDLDSDLVTFFRVLRQRPDELAEWLKAVPYSREVYERWAREFYQEGVRVDDDLERAGRFFFLRFTQTRGKAATKAGFKTRAIRNPARSFENARQRLDEVAERFAEVQIEHKDYREVVDLYDHDRTLFYLDPPYVGTERRYANGSGFDHSELVDTLDDLEGEFVVSYGADLPDGLAEIGTVVTRSSRCRMSNDADERLETAVCSFDPEATATQIQNGVVQETLFSAARPEDGDVRRFTDGGTDE